MKTLRVFTTSWCPDCRKAKRILTEKSVSFEEIDIEKNPEYVDLIVKERGKKVVPTLEYDGKYMDGNHFNEEKFCRDLKTVLGIPV